MARVHHPYDTFFRSVFSREDLAWELTRLVAPEIGTRFTNPRLTVDDRSLVEPASRSHYTDLLIGLREAGEESLQPQLFVYVLYEHKSSPDRWVSLQLLRYLGAIWQRTRREHRPPTLPAIVPVVIYHGREAWSSSLEFADLVDGPRGEYVPRFTPRLVNLADVAPQEISGSLGFVLALVALKLVRRRLTQASTRFLLSVLDRALSDPATRELARQVEWLYAATRPREDIDRMATIAAQQEYDRAREELMTYAEELLREGREAGLQEGREEGLQEGLQEGRREGELREKRAVLVRLLSRQFTLNREERQRILSSNDPAALDAALDEVVTAEDKDSVLRRLG